MISDSPVNEDKFHIRYKAPNGKIYEKTLVPQDKKDKEDREALHRLWFIFKDKMKKSKPKQDINIFQLLNTEPFKTRVRFEDEPEQTKLKI